jgi:hypothetical protein
LFDLSERLAGLSNKGDPMERLCRLVGFEWFRAAEDAVPRAALAGRSPDITEENIQARTRGVILLALSNKLGPMVPTTGNKSEMSVGYRVSNLLDLAEYKRRQAPPGVKITRKAFGRDRRYPITNAFRKVGLSGQGRDGQPPD